MTPSWVTIGVAALTAVVGLVGALGGQWLASNRAVKLAEIERQAARADQGRQERRDSYVHFLVAARLIESAARSADSATSDHALSQLREAGGAVEMSNSVLWDEHVAPLVEAAQGWVHAAVKEGPTGPAARETGQEYRSALRVTRERMRADLGRW